MTGRKRFDPDAAVDAAMLAFWADGFDATSIDTLLAATGLGRGSLYSTFGGKDALYARCLERYSSVWGERYERALAGAPGDPVGAVRAFFDVILERIRDPSVPAGCLIAQSAVATTTLSGDNADLARSLLARQRARLAAVLATSPLSSVDADRFAMHLVGVNQSLAVLSRAGTSEADLRAVVDVSIEALKRAVGGSGLPARAW